MINQIGSGGISSYLSNSKPVEQEEVFLAAQGEKAGVEGEPLEDEVSISTLAQLLSGDDALQGLLGVPVENNQIRLTDVATAQEHRIADFRDNLATMLGRAGIKSTAPIRLQVDSQGQIMVTNDHPQEEEIEALFEQNPFLASQFQNISATGSLLNAAREAEAFQEEYARDPYAAVRRYGYLFDDKSYVSPFQLTLFGEGEGVAPPKAA